MSYINLKYNPSKNDLIAEFYIEPNRISVQKAAEEIAAESSIGTWTDISTLTQEIRKRLSPSVFSIKKNIIKIAYPQELFEPGNMPQILSSIAGNIFGMKAVKNLRLMDISFPKKIVKSFDGPLLGIEGIRKMLKIKKRPFVGTIIKPKVGLGPKEHAKVAYEAWIGGLDFVKDDENLSNQRFNRFEERLKETLKMKKRAEQETGEKKIYLPNVTAETEEMLRRIGLVREYGNDYIMADVLTTGFSAMQTIRKNAGLPIHAHRAMHAALTRSKKHGISMLAIAKIMRLIGVDSLHIGTAFLGKMTGSAKECIDIGAEMEESQILQHANILRQDWHNLKPVLAVASGGLYPGLIPGLVKRMGYDVLMQFGGGVHGHPFGTIAGARAVRQALDAVMEGKSLKKYAEGHFELKEALKYWG